MTRLPTPSARQLIQALGRAGFVVDRHHGGHCILKHPSKNLTTTIPIHGKDIKRGLLKAILKQAQLSEEEFRELL